MAKAPYETQPLKMGDREFHSRLFVGTGKFSSNEAMRDALEASGTEIVTVALRRADLSGKKDPYANILEFIDPEKYLLLPKRVQHPSAYLPPLVIPQQYNHFLCKLFFFLSTFLTLLELIQ